MAEAIGLLARELRCVGTDELLAYERDQSWRLRLAVGERLDGALVEHVALDRAALEDGALRRVELIETSRQKRLNGRWHADLATARRTHERQHLLQEERVSLGGRGDALAQAGLDAAQLRQQELGLRCVERLEEYRRRVPFAAAPGGPLLEQLGAGHAEQEDRLAAREIGDVLDQIEQCLLRPVQVVEHADERVLVRLLLDQLAEAPSDLLRRGRGLRLPEQRPDRYRWIALRQRVELLDDLDHRPVRDPLAVGEAAVRGRRARRSQRGTPPPAATCPRPPSRAP